LGPQIQSTVQTSNPIALTERLGETLKQMQAAFACTLWGVLSAVLISTFTRRIGAQQGELLAQIQQLVLYELAPRLLPQSQESQLKDIRRVLAQSKGFIKDVSKVLTQSAQEFKIILNETGNKMAEIGTQLQETTESVQTTLSTVADNVKASATALQSSTEEVRKSAENLREAHTDLKQTYEDLLQRFDKSRTELEEQIQKQLTTIDDWRKELTRSAGEIAERVDTSSQNLKEATREFKNTGEVYRSTNHDLLQKMESGFQKMNEDTGTLFEEHRKEMGRVDAGLREIGERLRELYERLDPRLVPVGEWERLRNAWEGISKYLQSRIDGGIATTVSESHNGFHPELVEALKDLNARLEILQQRPLNLQVERLAEIAENLRTLNEQLSNVLGLVGDLDEISAEAKAFETQGNSEPPESDQPPGEQAIVQMVSMLRDEKEG
jgi:DNA repair exonuclease SbcCD ATPase subunit